MPRKKRPAENAAEATSQKATETETIVPTAAPAAAEIPAAAEESVEAHGKHWGPPYKAIVTSSAKGFEMGENRRFKQRVFKFKDKPEAEVLAELKDNGFTYRPEEKAWTIHADNATRLLSDQLAAKFAGESPDLFR